MKSLRQLVATALCLAFIVTGNALARESTPGHVADISVSELPKQGRDTLALIRAGGPYPFPKKDGTTFSNREKRLPVMPRGQYKEYTVPTPGSRDRGARRIVCSGDTRSAKDSACFYTGDHYASFKRIRE